MTTEYLLAEQVERVLGCMMPENALVCEVMLATGLRVSDVLRLRTDQLAPRMTIKEQKTGKKRHIRFKKDLFGRLQAQAGEKWVFEGRGGDKPRTRQAVWRDVKRAARAYRLPGNIGTHSMRKVYAVELLGKYGDMQRVRRALNHKDLATTVIYACADKLMQQPRRRRH